MKYYDLFSLAANMVELLILGFMLINLVEVEEDDDDGYI